MGIRTVYSTQGLVTDAAADIKNQLAGFDVKTLIYFASSNFDHQSISKLMQETFEGCVVFGCSTSGEIVSGRMLKNSIVAMAFSSDAISDIAVNVVEDIKNPNIKKVCSDFEEYFGQPMSNMDPSEYVGIVILDGMSSSEEKVMDKIGDLINLIFIGGSAGDDLKFRTTYVYANGKTYTNAAILALLKPTKGFDIIKTQSFKVLNKKLIATKVNEESREVIEFNNKPAVQAYAEALNIPVEEVPNCFMTNPVGLVIDDEVYVRSPQQVKGNHIVFYCNILEGMEVSLLESKDIVKDTVAAVQEKKRQLGTISGIINFHCILRTLELEKKGQTEQYGQIFSDIPTVGFSTYGEAYIGHINQTSTMLVFK